MKQPPFFRRIPIAAFCLALTFAAGLPVTLPAAPAFAEGIAMHGTPKYAEGFTHLDYVNPDAPKGGTYKEAALGTFDTLNPFSFKGKAAQGLSYVYDRLMARVWDEPFTLYPLIAEKADIPADRSSVTFHLNPSARFHDGTPITARDVLFSFETLKTQGRPNMRRIYALADEAKIIGPRTVYFHFGAGSDRETVMIFAMMPVLSEAFWQARFDRGHKFDETILAPPTGSGPYKIGRVDPGRRIVLERAPDYWAKDLPVNRGQYNFDRIIYDYYRDDTVAFEAFKSGAADFRREYDAAKWATGYDLPQVRNGTIKLEKLPHSRPERVQSMIFNTRRVPFDDIRVRKALSLLLDFNWLNRNIFHGQYRRIESYFPNAPLAASAPSSEAERALLAPFKDTLPPEVFEAPWKAPSAGTPDEWRAQLRQADTLLKEAGWIVQGGRRVNATDGRPFKIDMILGAPEDKKVALAFTRNLDRLGIAADIRTLDAAAFQGRLTDYDYDMVISSWINSLSPGTEQVLYWSCDAAGTKGRWNYAGICDPAVDALAHGMAGATTREELVTMAKALDRVLMYGYYTIPLYYGGTDNVAYKSTLRHPAVTPLYGLVLESWWKDGAQENGHKRK